MFCNLSAIYRNAYLKRYLYKEMDFIGTHYLKKNNKSGKTIYKKIMELDPALVRRMMTLYMMLQKKCWLTKCYGQQIQAATDKYNYLEVLICEIETCNSQTFQTFSATVEKLLTPKIKRLGAVPDIPRGLTSQIRMDFFLMQRNKSIQLERCRDAREFIATELKYLK